MTLPPAKPFPKGPPYYALGSNGEHYAYVGGIRTRHLTADEAYGVVDGAKKKVPDSDSQR